MGSWGQAGYDASPAQSTAVLAALSFWDYAFVAEVPGSDAYKATGRCISVAAGRISYTYGFKGASSLAADSIPCRPADARIPIDLTLLVMEPE